MKTHQMYLALVLMSMMGTFCGCRHTGEKLCLTKVVDMKREVKHEWHLKYDESKRLVGYGDTPISYEKGRIIIGGMEWESKGDKMYRAVFQTNRKGCYECESLCRLIVGGDYVDARKKTSFRNTPDTLFVMSEYYIDGIEKPLRKVDAKYVYDEKNRLSEVVSAYFDGGKEETGACHCYYGYGAGIRYESNLNMQAFLVDREGLDTFFYLLLNLGYREKCQSLPNQIRHCVNRGKAAYEADGLYRLDGNSPTKMEIISSQTELKARYEFEHLKLD